MNGAPAGLVNSRCESCRSGVAAPPARAASVLRLVMPLVMARDVARSFRRDNAGGGRHGHALPTGELAVSSCPVRRLYAVVVSAYATLPLRARILKG